MLGGLGAEVCAQDADGHSALALAAENEHAEMMKQLDELGADLLALDKDGRTTIHLAAYKGHTETSKVLEKDGGGCTCTGQLRTRITYFGCFLWTCTDGGGADGAAR